MNKAGCQSLGEAVVLQAVKDYRAALRALRRDPNDRIADGKAQDIESFFRTGLFLMVSRLDPDDLIRRLRKEAEGWKRRKRK